VVACAWRDFTPVSGGAAGLRAEPPALGARKSSGDEKSLAVWSEATEKKIQPKSQAIHRF